MTPSRTTTCSVCGTEVPEHSGMGLCPPCLVKSGVFGPKGKTAFPGEAEAVETLTVGQRVGGGRFSLVDLLGEGGMGVVWLALDEELSRGEAPVYVALKFLALHIRSDPHALDLMRTEVLQSRKLRHPRIVSIYDWHAQAGEPTFISMEYVEGVNLSQLLTLQAGGFMAWSAIAPWVKQLCDALDYAHSVERIIHRDLKPANLMLDQRSELKLADFGLARACVEPRDQPLARTHARGTPLYMSPQQMQGYPPHVSDDVYSLGATLYELLTGTPPFYTGEDILQQVLSSPPEPLAERLARLGRHHEVAPRVRMTIAACLDKEPANRPQSAREVAHRLGLALIEPARPAALPGTREVTSAEKTPPPRKSFSAVPILVLLVLLLVTAGHLFPSSAPVQALARQWDRAMGLVPGKDVGRPLPVPTRFAELRFTTDSTDASAVLNSLDGSVARSLHMKGTNGGFFANLATGRYTLQLSKEGYLTTNLMVTLRSARPMTLSLPLTPVASAAGLASTLTLISPALVPLRYRLWDEARQTLLRDELFLQRTTNQAGLAAGNYFMEAGVSNLEPSAFRLAQPFQVRTGANLMTVNFAPGRVHLWVDQDVKVVATDHWGARKSISLSPWLEGGKDKGFHSLKEMPPGEWVYSFSLPPTFEEFQTNLVISSQTLRECQVHMTPSVGPTERFSWTNSLGLVFRWITNAGFWACATETTRKQFTAFAEATRLTPQGIISVTTNGWRPRGDTWLKPGFPQADDEPVVGVNWEEATAFCAWLTTHDRLVLRTNQSYALPSAEQWSALAGTTLYPWGTNWPPPADVNCAGIEATRADWHFYWPTLPPSQHEDLWARTTCVTNGQPNLYGLHQVGGNVAEWCSDWYRKEMNPDTELRRRYPLLEIDGGGETYRVVRGGSWYDHHPDELRTDTHSRAKPDERHDRIGFRIVLVQMGMSVK